MVHEKSLLAGSTCRQTFLLYRKLLRNVPIKQQQSLVKIQRKGLRTAGTVIYYISSEK